MTLERNYLKERTTPFLYNTIEYNDPETHYIGPAIVAETDLFDDDDVGTGGADIDSVGSGTADLGTADAGNGAGPRCCC